MEDCMSTFSGVHMTTVLNGGQISNQHTSQTEFNDLKDELTITNDLIGLTFYEVSDQYKKKFLTLHQHFQFEHHPIRKLMEEFRKWLESFIKDKLGKIKHGAILFLKDNTDSFIQ